MEVMNISECPHKDYQIMDGSRNGNQDKCSNCNSKDITYFDISNGRMSYVCQKCSHVGSPQKDNDIDTDSEEDACRMVESDYAALIFTDSDKDDQQSDLQITKQNINKSKPQEAAAISRFNFDDESEQSSSGVTEDDGPILQYAVNCRCQYGCQCGNQMSDLFVHHELAHSFHILECMKCFRRREFGQTKEYITFRNEKDKEKCNILSSKGEHIDDGRLVLVCRGCGNMNECTFFDVWVGDDVTHKQCGWCDESLPITTPDSLMEQAFLCSPCSYCGNQVSELFLYTFGQDGYIERKECRKCDNTDIKLKNHVSEDDIMISEYTDREMEKMVQSLHNSEFSCPRCQNDDLYRFVITSLHDLDEIQIECDQCNFTSSIDNFSRWRHQISNNENCEHDDDDLNFEYAECSCDRGQGNYVSYKDANGKITNVVCTVCHDYTPIYHYVDGKDHSQDKVGYPSPKTSISDIHQLRPGDHIMYKRDVGYYHHEIIADVYHKTGSQRKAKNARVIHFTGIERNGNRGSASASFSSFSGNVKGEIREEDKLIDCENEAVYRVDYDRSICFEAEKVLRRARSRIGDTQYNILFNNCEHFARWCKTGKR